MLDIAKLYQLYSHQTAKQASNYATFFFQKSEVSNTDLEKIALHELSLRRCFLGSVGLLVLLTCKWDVFAVTDTES